ncbi:PulJ/GspJ family protein [Thalassotalea sediminis]|uniref:PulJ/GspJ family protein n=1 Tax=Thalassotalea sediminis TaxID=1759089 RepID=UPI0025742761|nr:prepilin-type N-terminal cleavage/methylation domain-containing protein [Thalassotalea sediminis]
MIKRRVSIEGFTLIEVLIAAIILFSSISLVAEIYSSSSIASKKSIQRVNFFQSMSLANKRINFDLRAMAEDKRSTSFSGSFEILKVSYKWNATRELFLAPPYDDYSEINWPAKFGFFNVQVTAAQQSFNRNYELKVVTW